VAPEGLIKTSAQRQQSPDCTALKLVHDIQRLPAAAFGRVG
jgi:hypothetical protein